MVINRDSVLFFENLKSDGRSSTDRRIPIKLNAVPLGTITIEVLARPLRGQVRRRQVVDVSGVTANLDIVAA